jgi:hypothetical protein
MRILLLCALVSIAARAEDHTHHGATSAPSDAQIVVTINPEARVSAVLGAPLPAPAACGSATALNVRVINQGFVTAALRASIIGDGVSSVALQMESGKLSGESNDSRTLHLITLGPDPVDVTVAFRIDKNIGDLGGRDRIHLLLRCNPIG